MKVGILSLDKKVLDSTYIINLIIFFIWYHLLETKDQKHECTCSLNAQWLAQFLDNKDKDIK